MQNNDSSRRPGHVARFLTSNPSHHGAALRTSTPARSATGFSSSLACGELRRALEEIDVREARPLPTPPPPPPPLDFSLMPATPDESAPTSPSQTPLSLIPQPHNELPPLLSLPASYLAASVLVHSPDPSNIQESGAKRAASELLELDASVAAGATERPPAKIARA